GLIESGDLRGLELKALVEAYPAQRARVGGAHGGVAPRTPDHARLGRKAVGAPLAARERRRAKILRILQPVVAHPGDEPHRLERLPMSVPVNRRPFEVGPKVRGRRWDENETWHLIGRVEIAKLVATAANERVVALLPDVLQL